MWLLLLNLYFDSREKTLWWDRVNDRAAVLKELSDERNIRRHQFCFHGHILQSTQHVYWCTVSVVFLWLLTQALSFVVELHQQTKFVFLKTCHSVTVSTYSIRLFLSAADGNLVYIYNFCHTGYVNIEVIFHFDFFTSLLSFVNDTYAM